MDRHLIGLWQNCAGTARRPRLGALALSAALLALPTSRAAAEPFVELLTSEGRIVLEMHPAAAPETVANFLGYVDDSFYAGTLVHRAIPGFMVQAGGYDESLRARATREPIDNEAARCLKNRRGTVAMARSMASRSTTSQFFINVEDNPHLDHVRPEPGYEGYCAFATVVEGMDVADRISRVATGPAGMFAADVPLEPVVIGDAQRISGPIRVAARAEEARGQEIAPATSPKPSQGSTMLRRPSARRGTP
ncbi:MAG: peptidyl-prolyl cis-trans isomerase [Rhodocyclaceae bacterium]|nr:peptidyl-prolyl cis-trans isomerase [Rhodocyclaceae bacterium]